MTNAASLAGALALALVTIAACGGTEESPAPAPPTTTRSAPEASWVDEPPPVVDAGPPVDSGVCPPPNVDWIAGSYLPPRAPRNESACATNQTTAIIEACELRPCGGVTVSDIGCFDCLFGSETDATYGLRVFEIGATRSLLNVRGIALRLGAPAACASALEDYEGCMQRACACSGQTGRGAASCLKKAKAGACQSWSAAVTAACAGSGAAPASALLVPAVETGGFASETDAVTAAKSLCGGT